MRCDTCRFYINLGPNMVPYGDTWVNEGDCHECQKGYDGDCPDDMYEPDELDSVRLKWRVR